MSLSVGQIIYWIPQNAGFLRSGKFVCHDGATMCVKGNDIFGKDIEFVNNSLIFTEKQDGESVLNKMNRRIEDKREFFNV